MRGALHLQPCLLPAVVFPSTKNETRRIIEEFVEGMKGGTGTVALAHTSFVIFLISLTPQCFFSPVRILFCFYC